MTDHDSNPAGSFEEAPVEPAETPEIDPVRMQMALERLRGEQSLGGAIGAGAAAAAVGAGAWAAVTMLTGFQIGWMAVGVGFLVGFAVRAVGKGLDKAFGFVGAGWALVGCAAGNLLTVCALLAKDREIGLGEVLAHLDLTIALELMGATFSPIDLLFYGIAVYEGYRFSFRQVTPADLDPMLGGSLGA